MSVRRLALLIAVAAAACAQPTSNRKIGGGLNFFSEKDEAAMGRRYSEELNRKLELVRDPQIVAYVTEMGQRLARNSRRNNAEYQFFVVNTKEVNAFALPGGFIYVNRGLIDLAGTESEVAGVIGHEIGHVVGRHATRQMSKNMLLAGLAFGAAAAVSLKSEKWGQIAGVVGGIGLFFASMKYSRDDERQADWLGMEEMNRAGYDPDGMIAFFEKLDRMSKGKGSPGLAFMSTHPLPAERVRNMKQEIAMLDAGPARPGGASPSFASCKAQLAGLAWPAPGRERTLSNALASLDPGPAAGGASAPSGPPPPQARAITIPGNSVWVDTGVDVAAGETLAIWAEGLIKWKKDSDDDCDAAGEPGTAGKGWLKPITRANTGALVGRIGANGAAFYVGPGASLRPAVAGRLYLGINDDNNFDNRGAFEAHINIVRE